MYGETLPSTIDYAVIDLDPDEQPPVYAEVAKLGSIARPHDMFAYPALLESKERPLSTGITTLQTFRYIIARIQGDMARNDTSTAMTEMARSGETLDQSSVASQATSYDDLQTAVRKFRSELEQMDGQMKQTRNIMAEADARISTSLQRLDEGVRSPGQTSVDAIDAIRQQAASIMERCDQFP
ncbi:hypothetical protein TI39_contig4277g00001 [Zymoseptoria brevis]|uniref:Uncharacterized protein n=1 Tax=Zymoseptoria brevis TaxID=1047168 RepID=A0A0F4G8H3_9PEZI|nr:hypothetical protein TI39_contig4277g00001 [Zymoseptoria brevis]